ncbi:prepilin peptidase [Solicola sp. PLA-1-18]|uniref:prepilin peptidase n=1 Tax=Solicola sp. PLA-1-18 TaxID=3380532 RepID=UPI003B7FEE1B
MSWAHLVVAFVMAVVGGAGGWLAPRVLARLPEPPPDDEDAPPSAGEVVDESVAGVEPVADDPAPPVPAKVPYAELAARPGLGVRLGVVAAVASGTIGLVLGPDPSLPAWAYLSVLGVLLSYVDWTTRLLPFRLVAPSYPVMALLLAGAALVSGEWSALLRAGLAWVAVFAVFLLMWLVYRRGIGYGDVRLSGILGMSLGWLGWHEVVVGLYAAFLVGAVVGGLLSVAKVVDRKGYAFGPFLLLGTWIGVVATPAIGGAVGWS